MPYRDSLEALHTRCAALEQELAAIDAKARELDGVREKQAELKEELASARRVIGEMKAKKTLPLLDDLRIASPCTADWSAMTGDEQVRFCGSCQKDVYNLSAMAREDAERLLRERTHGMCVRIYRRADGTVMTSDCPVGVRRKRRRKAAIATVGGGLLAAMAFAGLRATTGKPAHVMGDMEVVAGGIAGPADTGSPAMTGTAAPPTAVPTAKKAPPAPRPESARPR